MISEYRLICHPDPAEFVRYVNEAIKDGWQPIGGVSLTLGNGGKGFAQALVKGSNTNDPTKPTGVGRIAGANQSAADPGTGS